KTKHQQNQKPVNNKKTKWTPSTNQEIWKSLFYIKGTHNRYTYFDNTIEESSIWNIQHLYQGLVPKCLIQKWKSLFNTSSKIAKYMVYKFCNEVENLGYDIWKQRCEKIINWERSINISQKNKKSRPIINNNSLSFHNKNQKIRSGICICGGYLVEHINGQCLNAKDEENKADQNAIDSFLGKSHLDMMERLGNFQFNFLLLKELD